MKPIVILMTLILGACGYRDTQIKGSADGGNSSQGAPPPPGGSQLPGAGAAPDFAMVRAQIFVPHCIRCHGSSGRINLETYESVRPVVQTVLNVVNSGRMPPAGPLIPSLKNILQAWVSGGAPQTTGTAPPSGSPGAPGAPTPAPPPCSDDRNDDRHDGDRNEPLRRGDDDC